MRQEFARSVISMGAAVMSMGAAVILMRAAVMLMGAAVILMGAARQDFARSVIMLSADRCVFFARRVSSDQFHNTLFIPQRAVATDRFIKIYI